MASSRAKATLDGLHALYPAPGWVKGATPMGDAEFLVEMVTAHEPGRLVELGVAAGVSSAVSLRVALDCLPVTSLQRQLYSCDVQSACYFDPSRATGEVVNEMYPRSRASWILDTDTDARRICQSLEPASVDLTFIDANHYHPWPLLDLLHMTAPARRGSWVMLHDINLPIIAPKFAAWGAKWLFDEWPFEKIAGGGAARNIGAVRLPDELARLVPLAIELLERPWEHAPTLWHLALPAPFSPIQQLLRARFERSA